MADELYDAEHIARYYDAYGDFEWERLEATLQGRATHATHTAALERHLPSDAKVLEIGAGPGRFTIELARLGASVVVADISPVQLQAHRVRIGSIAAEAAVLDRLVADVSDLSGFGDDEYDAVVAYGGPVSYVFDRAGDALAGMCRVLRPGGIAFMSVMSLLGAARIFRQAIAELTRHHGLELILDHVLATGDLHDERVADKGHRCRMYRSHQIVALVASAGLEVVDVSASNFLFSELDGLQVEAPLPESLLTGLLAREVEICREPGVVDAGSHILVVARKPGGTQPHPLPASGVSLG
jgi:ubiquinone/menaquinone biosynthesis C-methylase UbiE